MPTLFSRYATPFITGLFLVSFVSGVALFFHWQQGAFRGMHEWLSMVLILPFVLHLWKNWRPFLAYCRRPPMAIAMGLSLAASLAFAWPSITGTGQSAGGNPAFAMAAIVTSATPAQIAPLLGQTEQSVLAMLKQKGFSAAESGRMLKDIASTSGKEPVALMATLAAMRTQP